MTTIGAKYYISKSSMDRAQQYLDQFNKAVKAAGNISAYMTGPTFHRSKPTNTQKKEKNRMDNNITLTLAPQHLRPLRHMCQANYESIMADPEASKEAKKTAADLYRRVMLLHNAVNAEEIAENTRAKYDRYIADGKKPAAIHTNRSKKPPQIDTANNNNAEEKPPEQAQEPPQDLPAIPEIPDIPAQESTENMATVQPRPF